MAGKCDRFLGDTFLQAAITIKREDVLIKDNVIGCVELCRRTLARKRVANRIADSLAEWTSGGFDAGSVAKLGMSWCFGAEHAEVFHFI